MRRVLEVCLVALLVCGGAAGARTRTTDGTSPAVAATADARSLFAQLVYTATISSGALRDGTTYAQVWPLSQVLAASVEVAGLPGSGRELLEVRRLVSLANRYWDGVAYEPIFAGSKREPAFYDDNDWVALDLVDAADALHDPALLERAREIFAWIQTGWDRSSSDPCNGGIFWTSSATHVNRNAVSTANAAVLALELFARTKRPGYRQLTPFDGHGVFGVQTLI